MHNVPVERFVSSFTSWYDEVLGDEKRITLFEFVQQAWDVIEPRKYVHNWHIEAVCDHLEAVTNGDIKKIVINIPVRHTKSMLVSVFWPAWEWTFNPGCQWLYSSHSARLANRDSGRCRTLIESSWYKHNWGNVYALSGDQNQKTYFENDCGGHRIANSLESRATGLGADRNVCDDPHDIKDRRSDIKINNQVDAWDSVMSKRVNDPQESTHTVIMQRVSENDLTAWCLDNGYEHLCLPSEFEVDNKCRTSIGFEDPRTTEGELLNPDRYPEKVLVVERKNEALYAAIHQQRPSPAEGDEVKRIWWNYWHLPGQQPPPVPIRTKEGIQYKHSVELPPMEKFRSQCQSWDLAFKDMDDSSYVVGQVWGLYDANSFLLHQVRERLSFTNTIKSIKAVTSAYPKALMKLIEDKANGPAVINSLSARVPGMIPIQVKDSKLARARAVTPVIESGNIYLPHPSISTITTGFIEEWAAIPNPGHWDQIDAGSQYLSRMYQGFLEEQWLTWGRKH